MNKKYFDLFLKHFQQVCYGFQYSEVFKDFLDICICTFSLQEYEDEYFKLLTKYKQKNFTENFAPMLSCLINSVTEGIESNTLVDILGDIYMEISSKYKSSSMGQFFTPTVLCEAMIKFTMKDNKEIGVTGNDPACGSGRLPIAGFLKNKYSFWLGADLDIICVKMTIVNFWLYGMINSEVSHMNTLSLEYYGGYRIALKEFDYNGNKIGLPCIRKITVDEQIKKIGCSGYFYHVMQDCKSGAFKSRVEEYFGINKVKKIFSLMENLFKDNNEINIYDAPKNKPDNICSIKQDKEILIEVTLPINQTVINLLPKPQINQTVFTMTKSVKNKKLEQAGQTNLFNF